MAQTRERKVKKELYKLCEQYKAIHIPNIVSPYGGIKGFPDESLIRRDGSVAFIECKAEGTGEEGLAPLQRIWRDKLIKQGARWFLFNNSETSREEIETWLIG